MKIMFACIAMIIGFAMGAGCVLLAIREERRDCAGRPQSTHDDSAHTEEACGEVDEALKRQLENFLNYDGTSKGQMPIGDE